MKSKDAFSLEEKLWQLRQHIKKQTRYFANKGALVKTMVFPVWMWELDHKDSWTLKNWCFWAVLLEKTLESPLDCKEIKPVNPKGNQPWIFIRMTDAEAEAPVLWTPDAKSWLIRKDPDAGKDWRQEVKGMTKDDLFGSHHLLNGHEFEQALRDGEGQGSLVCCSPQANKELDMAEWLNNNILWWSEIYLRNKEEWFNYKKINHCNTSH